MSGTSIPYHLRPNKHIDREIFFDCVKRVLAHSTPEDYAYMSMGGKHLVDHSTIYRAIGISQLLSFDMDAHIVARQNFNKPFASVDCRELSSKKFLSDFESITNAFPDATNFIVWLDYTSASNRLQQLQEFQSLLQKMAHGDIARITVNADPRNSNPRGDHSFKTIFEYRLDQFQRQMRSFAGTLTVDSMQDEKFPYAVAACVANAAKGARSGTGHVIVRPLNIQWYTDGTPMVSLTCVVLERSKADEYMSHPSIASWPYLAKKWSDVSAIRVPDLSITERAFIDQAHPTKAPKIIASEIGFLFDGDLSASEKQIQSYISYNRFYPSFKRIDA